MGRVRISTTVDSNLLETARKLAPNTADAQLIDRALGALAQQHRRASVDAAYEAAYETHPIDTPDEWGDLASFRRAASQK